jgi:hypothetical protein
MPNQENKSGSRIIAQKLVAQQMDSFALARSNKDIEGAWRALEYAHILSQHYLIMHLSNHLSMLKFAISQRDIKEAAGQIMRLALVPLGNMTGRIPSGNTGRSNVSAFEPMPIPDDLKAMLPKGAD